MRAAPGHLKLVCEKETTVGTAVPHGGTGGSPRLVPTPGMRGEAVLWTPSCGLCWVQRGSPSPNTFCVPGTGRHDFRARGAPPTQPLPLPADQASRARPRSAAPWTAPLQPSCACSESRSGRSPARTAAGGGGVGAGPGKHSSAGRGPAGDGAGREAARSAKIRRRRRRRHQGRNNSRAVPI